MAKNNKLEKKENWNNPIHLKNIRRIKWI
jgi:hypothetical protein